MFMKWYVLEFARKRIEWKKERRYPWHDFLDYIQREVHYSKKYSLSLKSN